MALICAVPESPPIVSITGTGLVVLFRMLSIRLASKTYLSGVLVNIMNTQRKIPLLAKLTGCPLRDYAWRSTRIELIIKQLAVQT